jgi:cellulose synthase/poly-beta-1,6-N-acetylglucosamine synthase-like glycosyltransferase
MNLVMIISLSVFALSFGALFWCYVLYPPVLNWLAKGKKQNQLCFESNDELPHIAIVMAVYNEDAVIENKLKSIVSNGYPADKLHLFISSDNSTDSTHEIIEKADLNGAELDLEVLEGRNGKIRSVNRAVERALQHPAFEKPREAVLVSTDANVMFAPGMLQKIASHFKNPKIGLVAPYVLNEGDLAKGVAGDEAHHVNRANKMKQQEGVLWGATAGAFGACYAIRADLFDPVPINNTCDDFYLTYRVIEQGFDAIVDAEAVCTEDLPSEMGVEFGRKIRNGMGNFLNLVRFKHFLHPARGGIAFSFFSHRVIRWFGPFLLAAMFVSSLAAALAFPCWPLWLLFGGQAAVYLGCLYDLAASKMGLPSLKPLRTLRYFFAMNLALFVGFTRFVRKSHDSVWTPTTREAAPTT